MAVTVVKQVVAEVRGKTDQLDRELAVAEQRLGKTKRAIEGNSTAVGTMGNQYGSAARQIASATENISRAGNVTGEAAKQILFSGSQIAFAFGTKGAIVGALSVFTLAAVQAFQTARDEAKKLAEEFDREIRNLQGGTNYQGAGSLLTRLLVGDPNAASRDLQRPFQEIEKELLALRAKFPAGVVVSSSEQSGLGQTEERARLVALEAIVAERKRQIDEAQRVFNLAAQREQERLATGKKISDEEKALAAGRVQTARESVDAAKGITAALADANRALAEYDKEVAAFGAGFESLVLEEIGTAAEQLAAKFNELIGKGTALEGANSPRVQQLITLRDSAVQAASAIAASERTLSALELAAAQGTSADVTVFGRLAEDAARLSAELARLKPGTQAFTAVQQQLLKVERERAKLLDGVGSAGDSTSAATRSTADLAREIQQAVDGALQLAQAFGDVDASVINVLRSVGQVVGNLPALQTALKASKAGEAGAGLGVVSAALPIAGALATTINALFGDSPAEQARREVLRKNTEAIKELTAKAGLLGIGVTGSDSGSALAAINEVLRISATRTSGNTLSLPGEKPFDFIEREFGLTFTELQRIAESYGITLTETVAGFEQFRDALQSAITKLGEFDTDLASQLQQAQAEIDIFGITDPAEQLRIRNQATAGRSPALDRVLQGLDLNTAEGREQARLNAQALFDILKAGGDKLSDTDLGGLTGDELLQAILQLVGSLNDVDESLGLNTTTATQADQVVASDRTQITVDQASRLLGLASSQLSELRIIRQALTAAVTPLALPSADVFAGARGGTTLVINQTIEINGNVTDGAAIAQQSMDAIVDYVRRELGKDVRVRRQYQGEAVIS